MPGFNGNGPTGQGAMTGRGMGRCTSGNTNIDREIGFGRGRGFGCRNGFRGQNGGFGMGRMGGNMAANQGLAMNNFKNIDDEVSYLEKQANQLEQSLGQIQQRLDQLKKE